MDAIGEVLQQWMKIKGVSEHDMAQQVEGYMKHPIFLQWWQNHPEWETTQLIPYINKIAEYVKEQQNCRSCNGLHECKNLIRGHAAEMESYHNFLDVSYGPCHFFKKAEEVKKRSSMVRSHKIPKDIMEGTLGQFDLHSPGREEAFEAVLQFTKDAQPGKNSIGLYLYGPLGAGKSYLLGAACNKLAERGIATYMVYSPDFFREMKGAIAEQNLEQKLQVLKEIPVLIFDDIGAENISAWARDEILGAILQYRVMERLPTLYTSNYDYDQLEEHLAYSQKGGIEQLKAKRIMERIRHYTDAYFVDGHNRRARRT